MAQNSEKVIIWAVWFVDILIANGILISAVRQPFSGGKGFNCLCAAIFEGVSHIPPMTMPPWFCSSS